MQALAGDVANMQMFPFKARPYDDAQINYSFSLLHFYLSNREELRVLSPSNSRNFDGLVR